MTSRTSSSWRGMPRCVTAAWFLAENIGRGDDPDDLAILVHHQQQPHPSLDHATMGFVQGIAGQNDHRGRASEIGHHLHRRIVHTDVLHHGLRRWA